MLRVAQSHKKAIRNKLNVLAHQPSIHTNERDRERVCQEVLLDINGLCDNAVYSVGVCTLLQVAEQEACKVGMKAFVARNELIGERQTRHEATFLEPEDGSE